MHAPRPSTYGVLTFLHPLVQVYPYSQLVGWYVSVVPILQCLSECLLSFRSGLAVDIPNLILSVPVLSYPSYRPCAGIRCLPLSFTVTPNCQRSGNVALVQVKGFGYLYQVDKQVAPTPGARTSCGGLRDLRADTLDRDAARGPGNPSRAAATPGTAEEIGPQAPPCGAVPPDRARRRAAVPA